MDRTFPKIDIKDRKLGHFQKDLLEAIKDRAHNIVVNGTGMTYIWCFTDIHWKNQYVEGSGMVLFPYDDRGHTLRAIRTLEKRGLIIVTDEYGAPAVGHEITSQHLCCLSSQGRDLL